MDKEINNAKRKKQTRRYYTLTAQFIDLHTFSAQQAVLMVKSCLSLCVYMCGTNHNGYLLRLGNPSWASGHFPSGYFSPRISVPKFVLWSFETSSHELQFSNNRVIRGNFILAWIGKLQKSYTFEALRDVNCVQILELSMVTFGP